MKECKANQEGEYCDNPVCSGGYCELHQSMLPFNARTYPRMKKTHRKKYISNKSYIPKKK